MSVSRIEAFNFHFYFNLKKKTFKSLDKCLYTTGFIAVKSKSNRNKIVCTSQQIIFV